MPKCPVCGKDLKNPDAPRHINSKFHQAALKKEQSLENKENTDLSETTKKQRLKKENNIPDPYATEDLGKILIDKAGYLKITELESLESQSEKVNDKVRECLKLKSYELHYTDLDDFLSIIDRLTHFLSFEEILLKLSGFNRKNIQDIIQDLLSDFDQAYFSSAVYGFDLCIKLISSYLGSKALIDFTYNLEDLEDIISNSYYEEIEAPYNPSLFKLERTLSETLKTKSQEQYEKAISIIHNGGLFFEHLKKDLMNTYRINEFITLKLVGNRTNIYVNDRLFNQCKYLLLNITQSSIPKLKEIDSIDEAAEKLDRSMEGQEGSYEIISPETEFWGHCSNLQAWVENDYDTRLLHRNLAFPLLLKLTQVGDQTAKKVLQKEILKRIDSGAPNVIQYLLNQGYLRYLTTRDIDNLLEKVMNENLVLWKTKSLQDVLERFIEMGSLKARELLNELKLKNLRNIPARKLPDVLNNFSFEVMDGKKIEEIFACIEKKVLENKDPVIKLKILNTFANLNFSKALTYYKDELFNIAAQKDLKLISSSVFLNYLDRFNPQELTKLFKALDLKSRELTIEKLKVLQYFSGKRISKAHVFLLQTTKKAFNTDNKDLIQKLITDGFLRYLKKEEIENVFRQIISKKFFDLKDPVSGEIIEQFIECKVEDAHDLLKLRIKEILQSTDIPEIKNLDRNKYLDVFSTSEFSKLCEELNFDDLFSKNLN